MKPSERISELIGRPKSLETVWDATGMLAETVRGIVQFLDEQAENSVSMRDTAHPVEDRLTDKENYYSFKTSICSEDDLISKEAVLEIVEEWKKGNMSFKELKDKIKAL